MNKAALTKEWSALTALRNKNSGEHIKSTQDFIDQIIPKSPMSGIIRDTLEQQAAPLRTLLSNSYMQAMQQAMNENKDLSQATTEWKAQAVASPEVVQSGLLEIPRTALVAITDNKGQSKIDMSGLDIMGVSGGVLTPADINNTFGQSVAKINAKYSVPAMSKMSQAEKHQARKDWAEANPRQFNEYKNDMNNLLLQKAHYEGQMRKASKPKDGSLNPNQGK